MEMLVTEDYGGAEAVWTVYIVSHAQNWACPSSAEAVQRHPCPWWLAPYYECCAAEAGAALQ